MRLAIITGMAAALVLGGCSSPQSAPKAAEPQAGVAASTPAGKTMLGDEPASSPSAQAARDVVTRYFAAIDAHDYAAAYALWGNKGADTRGSLQQFKDGITEYSVYKPTVGEPTAIKSREGKQYILVTAAIDVKSRKTGRTAARSGTVMLSRSADPNETDPDKKDWRIWGTDIRKRH